MKHEFKVGDLVRLRVEVVAGMKFKNPFVLGSPSRTSSPTDATRRMLARGCAGLGFIYKITSRCVFVKYASGVADVYPLSDFSDYFERATKTK